MPLAEPVLVASAAILGSLLGSFLNVCVHRLPRGESVIRPRSRCPSCGTPIAWRDNIPVVSWLLLLGKCRHCGTRISIRYAIVELVIAGVWAGSVARLGPTVDALSAAVFITLLVGILLTDMQDYVIPLEFSLGGLGAGLAMAFLTDLGILRSLVGAGLGFFLLWAVKAGGDFAVRRGWIRTGQEGSEEQGPQAGREPTAMAVVYGVSSAVGALGGTLFSLWAKCGAADAWQLLIAGILGATTLVLVARVGIPALEAGEMFVEKLEDLLEEGEEQVGMGWGDVYMMAMIGSFVGPVGVMFTVFLGALAGLLSFVPFMIRGRKPLIPFGVFLALGGVAVQVAGDSLASCYFHLLTLP